MKAAGRDAGSIAEMGHEIRTQTNVILGMTRMLIETRLTAEQREFADAVWSSAHALIHLIDDAPRLARPGPPADPAEPPELKSSETTGDPLRRFAARAGDGETTLNLRIDADPSARVLVVEDDAVNRKVALKMVEMLGCRAEAVFNGREALRRLEAERYDLVLMDCQMPDLDGYEASREIRRRFHNSPRVPIVGLTAHALPGDREKCLAAGMDGYLSKPVMLEEIASVLDRWLRGSRPGEIPGGVADRGRPDDDPPPIERDFIESLERADEATDGGFLAEMIAVFLRDLDRRVPTMREELERGHIESLATIAHALRGSCACFGAEPLVAACAELQAAAREGRTRELSPALHRIGVEADRVRQALEAERIKTKRGRPGRQPGS